MVPPVAAEVLGVDLAGLGIIATSFGAIAAAVATLRSIGVDRDRKLMENFEKKILASQGEAEIWKRRALDAEQRSRDLEYELQHRPRQRP